MTFSRETDSQTKHCASSNPSASRDSPRSRHRRRVPSWVRARHIEHLINSLVPQNRGASRFPNGTRLPNAGSKSLRRILCPLKVRLTVLKLRRSGRD